MVAFGSTIVNRDLKAVTYGGRKRKGIVYHGLCRNCMRKNPAYISALGPFAASYSWWGRSPRSWVPCLKSNTEGSLLFTSLSTEEHTTQITSMNHVRKAHIMQQSTEKHTTQITSMNHVRKEHIICSKAQKRIEHKSLPKSLFQKHTSYHSA